MKPSHGYSQHRGLLYQARREHAVLKAEAQGMAHEHVREREALMLERRAEVDGLRRQLQELQSQLDDKVAGEMEGKYKVEREVAVLQAAVKQAEGQIQELQERNDRLEGERQRRELQHHEEVTVLQARSRGEAAEKEVLEKRLELAEKELSRSLTEAAEARREGKACSNGRSLWLWGLLTHNGLTYQVMGRF